MLLSKDAFYQGKKDGLQGLSERQATEHAKYYNKEQLTNYTNGFIYGMNARRRAIIEDWSTTPSWG